jgi:EVE domain
MRRGRRKTVCAHGASKPPAGRRSISRLESANYAMNQRNYCIGVVSRSHVQIGVQGRFMQLNHGKKAPLQRVRAGDGVAIYSPRTEYPDGEPLQRFTAIGVLASGEGYQVEMSPDFKPYRGGHPQVGLPTCSCRSSQTLERT